MFCLENNTKIHNFFETNIIFILLTLLYLINKKVFEKLPTALIREIIKNDYLGNLQYIFL